MTAVLAAIHALAAASFSAMAEEDKFRIFIISWMRGLELATTPCLADCFVDDVAIAIDVPSELLRFF